MWRSSLIATGQPARQEYRILARRLGPIRVTTTRKTGGTFGWALRLAAGAALGDGIDVGGGVATRTGVGDGPRGLVDALAMADGAG